ncbi:unnamed protein product [Ectocarpus sp. CCAP 1310/34]|nr:unnamed protein product [Ectocarpus sp. CCAP 1310/34]
MTAVGCLACWALKAPKVTGLQTLQEYLCMNGRDTVDCGRRTVVATLTRALLGSWEGSATMQQNTNSNNHNTTTTTASTNDNNNNDNNNSDDNDNNSLPRTRVSRFQGRELFDQSVLKNPDRSGPVGLGLEVLLQCLVQDDGAFGQQDMAVEAGEDIAPSQASSSSEGSRDSDSDAAPPPPSSRNRRRRTAVATASFAALSPEDETRACVTIIGNYVRADPDTSGAFFRDVIPKVLLMGMGGGRQGQSGGSRRIPPRLAALLRSLVRSTRSRNSFNMERMVVHTVKEVKAWGDPSVVLLSSSAASDDDEDNEDDNDVSSLGDDVVMGGSATVDRARARNKGKGKKGGRASSAGNDKLRRRGLVLACTDILGHTSSCMSLIRQEMVEGEAKASLRSAVADGLLEYRRTCSSSDTHDVQTVLLGVLSSLALDGVVSVRLSALAAIGEGCSSDCVPGVSLLLERCLDAAPKVRALALRLLVDEFRVGVGAVGASLARAVLSPSPSADRSGSAVGTKRAAPDSRYGPRGNRSPGVWEGGLQGGEGGVALLGELMRHHQTLQETDSDRFPLLLRNLVEAVLRGESLPPRPSDATRDNDDGNTTTNGEGRDGPDTNSALGDVTRGSSGGGVNLYGNGVVGGAATTTGAKDSLLGPWSEGGGIAWADLAAPAARLCAACRPLGPAQLDVLDRVLGDIFQRRGG